MRVSLETSLGDSFTFQHLRLLHCLYHTSIDLPLECWIILLPPAQPWGSRRGKLRQREGVVLAMDSVASRTEVWTRGRGDGEVMFVLWQGHVEIIGTQCYQNPNFSSKVKRLALSASSVYADNFNYLTLNHQRPSQFIIGNLYHVILAIKCFYIALSFQKKKKQFIFVLQHLDLL